MKCRGENKCMQNKFLRETNVKEKEKKLLREIKYTFFLTRQSIRKKE